jgi:anti-sigma regulatory factor (Ser/Thr protein kinase)
VAGFVAEPDQRTMEIEPTATAVRNARRLVADAIGQGDDDVVDRALLCASELLTNAIEHAEPPATLRIVVDDRRVRIEVDDNTVRMPILRHPDVSSIRGRGMLVVKSCSDRWGIVSRPGGKTVWCEVGLAAAQRAARGPMAAAPPR